MSKNVVNIFCLRVLKKLNRIYLHKYQPQTEVRKDYNNWRIKETQRLYDIFKQKVNFKNKLLVDVGCGKGQPAIFYALYSEISHIYGIDMEPECIKYAIKLAESKGVKDKVTFVCNKDNKTIPLDSNSADIVLLQDMLEHAPTPYALLDECKRILRPSGFLCVEFYHYYHRNGSHLTGYIKIPWHHIILPANVLIEYVQQQPNNSFGVDNRKWAIHVFSTLNRFSYTQFISYINKLNLEPVYNDIKREQINTWKMILSCLLPFLRNTLFLRGTISVFKKV